MADSKTKTIFAAGSSPCRTLQHETHEQQESSLDRDIPGNTKKTRNDNIERDLESLEKEAPELTKSMKSGLHSRVPKDKRRGLLSFATILPEISDAREYGKSQKLTVVLIVALAAVSGPMGTTILLPAVQDLCRDLHTSLDVVNISIGVYLISLGIFPMWWTNFSEHYGRRSVYVLSFTLFFAFSIACAVAPSINALIGFRLLAGLGASAVQSCGAGTISDLYVQEERGTALGLFYLGPLLGPLLSPIIGGALAEAWGWRASMWAMVIVCGTNLVLIIFFLPETLPRNTAENLEKKVTNNVMTEFSAQKDVSSLNPESFKHQLSRRTRKNWFKEFYDHVVRPAHALVLLAYPPVLLVIVYCSIGSTGIYFLNISISNSYSLPPCGFSPVIVGLMYIPNSVTFILASIYGGRWNDALIRRSKKRHNGQPEVEARLSWNVVAAAVIFPPACMIYGWCIDKKLEWPIPLVGSALLGISAMLIMGSTVTYLVDILPGKGATGVALNNLVRQILAATAMFVTEPAVKSVGTGVLFSIYAAVVTVASLAILALKHYGPQLREKYDLSSYYAML